MKTTLLVFLFIYIIYALVKFFEFFYRKKETRKWGLDLVYVKGNGRVVKTFDSVMFIILILMLIALLTSGVEYLSFTTGLLVGMTIIQAYFHRFDKPLPKDDMPPEPITALKMESYSIQMMPGRAWRELLFMTVVLIWCLYEIAHRGFHWF